MDNENGTEGDNNENTVQQEVITSTSSDYSDIVTAILYIPATLVVLSFFYCIFKMFINRRTRG